MDEFNFEKSEISLLHTDTQNTLAITRRRHILVYWDQVDIESNNYILTVKYLKQLSLAAMILTQLSLPQFSVPGWGRDFFCPPWFCFQWISLSHPIGKQDRGNKKGKKNQQEQEGSFSRSWWGRKIYLATGSELLQFQCGLDLLTTLRVRMCSGPNGIVYALL